MEEQPVKREMSTGKCSLCDGTFKKSMMTRHLARCARGEPGAEKPAGRKSGKVRTFHLVVEGRGLPKYWMHLEMPAGALLADLDGFLRETWLECCGHMSAFRIEGREYVSGSPDGMLGDEGMDMALGTVLGVGMKFYHDYDFGTTTELVLKVVAEQEGERRYKTVQLLARNDSPRIDCSCGEPARQVCTDCIWHGEGWLCDACARRHECDEEMFLPVVNSPRVGMCGYRGQ